MNKRQKKKHLKRADRLALFSFDLADRYLKRYRLFREPIIEEDLPL